MRKFSLLISLFIFIQLYAQDNGERISNYDVEHISVNIKIDLYNKRVDGIVTTSIKAKDEIVNTINADAVNMNIKSVKGWILNATDDPELAESYEDIKYEYDKKNLKIHMPGNGLKKNFPYKYRVEYSVTDPERGMYFISPHSYDMTRPYQVWTQGEGEDNRYWFPGYDYPNDKATTETIITIDSQYVTLSNGKLVSTKNNEDGTKTWHWKLDKPHSSYLVMIAAGKFDSVKTSADNIPIYSYVPVGRFEEGELAFRYLPDMVKFYNEYTGFKYPWERLSQVVVKDFIYSGMENTGAVVLFEDVIYGENVEPDYKANGLVAHELAHQWWGDVVTCRSWTDMWLNESFATYYEALFNENQLGKDEFDYEIMKNGDNAITADSTVARRPIRTERGLTVNTYDKGSVVLNMLRYLLGDDKFRSAMNLYLARNQFQNVTTKDLIDAVNETANDDYTFFFEDWIYKAGQPEYKVKYDYDESSKTVKLTHQQVQRMDSSTVFRIHIPVEIITSVRKYNELVTVTDKEEMSEFKVDSKPIDVVFNSGNKILSKLYFNKPLGMKLYQLSNSENAIDRITAVKLLKDDLSQSDVINALFSALKNDKFWGARFEAAKMLEKANVRKNFMELTDVYSSEQDTRVKRRILTTIGSLFEKCSSCLDKDKLMEFFDNELKNEARPYVTGELIKNRAKLTDKDKIYGFIKPYLEVESHNDVIKRNAIEALFMHNDMSTVNTELTALLKTVTRSRTRNLILSKLTENKLDMDTEAYLKEILVSGGRYSKIIVLGYLEKYGTMNDITELNLIKERSNDERFIKRVDEVINTIRSNN